MNLRFINTVNNCHASFSEVVASIFSDVLERLTKYNVKDCIDRIKEFCNIGTMTECKVDFIRTDFPDNPNVTVSKDSMFCFPIIYVVTRQSDLGSGMGQMEPHAHFFNLYDALDYMFDIPGIQGRRSGTKCGAWFEEKFGDYRIEIEVVHPSAMSAHTMKEVAQAKYRAQAQLKTAIDSYMARKDSLVRHHVDTDHMVEPKFSDYYSEPKRNFIPEQ